MVALWAYHHHLLPITKRKIVIGCLISPSKTLMPFCCNNLGIFIVSMFVSLDYLSGCLIGISPSFTINHRENSLGCLIGVSKNLLPFLLQLSMFCWKKELVGPCRKWCGSARLKSVSQEMDAFLAAQILHSECICRGMIPCWHLSVLLLVIFKMF